MRSSPRDYLFNSPFLSRNGRIPRTDTGFWSSTFLKVTDMQRRPPLLPGLLVLLIAAISGCRAPSPVEAPEITWASIDSINAALPPGIEVFHGSATAVPLRAWYLSVSSERIADVRVLVSEEESRRSTVASFGEATGACAVVNAGYFTMDRTPAGHVGLLKQDGEVLEPATRSVDRNGVNYETARATLALTENRADIAWGTTLDGVMWRWPVPPAHREGRPALPLEYVNARPWEARDAIGAGPALVVNGRIHVTDTEEIFFGTSIPNVHPRTAAGITRQGDLILMVVDGRQDASRGVDLHELAALMRSVGAYQAVNLDGGGSSSIWVNGHSLNRPAGGDFFRPVMSAIGVYCHD
jgi:hypothetical protein